MSSDKPDGGQRYGAYDHLKRKAAQKSTTQAAASAGTPAIMKVFFIGIILFGGLLVSGVLTGDPFGGFGGGDGPNDFPNDPNNGSQNQIDLSQECVNHDPAGLSAHYHYDLFLYIDNNQQTVPSNVGIEGSCYRPMHTHAANNYVHVELPSSYTGSNPPISLFFEIWGQSFSETSLLGQSGTVSMEVNGSPYSGDLTIYPPQDGDEINIYLVTS